MKFALDIARLDLWLVHIFLVDTYRLCYVESRKCMTEVIEKVQFVSSSTLLSVVCMNSDVIIAIVRPRLGEGEILWLFTYLVIHICS